MRRSAKGFDRFSFGGRVPGAIGLILAVTITTSLVAAFGSHHASPLFDLGALAPERVFLGEIWRLLTWVVIEPSPLTLLFACLLLYWFGSNLADEWGSRRFLAVYVGVALVAGVGSCLVALVDEDVVGQRYLGSWPLAEAITVAWGLWFPTRVVRIYFVIPIKGLVLAWGTVALTVVYAIYSGWEHFLPSLLSEGAMLGWAYRSPFTTRWSAWKRARSQRTRVQRTQQKNRQRLATVHVLRQLEEKDDDLPPLSPEVEGELERIIRSGADDARKKPTDKPS